MEWKKCIFDETVEISDFGQVRKFLPDIHLPDGSVYERDFRYISPYLYGKYLHVNFNNESYLLHRLVAEHFVPNPEGLEIVKFNDGDIMNVRATNLIWTSRSDRMKEILSSKNYKTSSGKSKQVYCRETDTVYPNIKSCFEALKCLDENMNYDTMSRRLRKHHETEYLSFHLEIIPK